MNLKKLTLIGIFLPMLFTNGKVTVTNSNKQIPINSRTTRTNSGQVTYEYECTDRLDYERVGITSTNYDDWSIEVDPDGSRASYAGNSMGRDSSINLRTNYQNSGIVSTSSGGTIKSITVTFTSDSSVDRGIEIYGSNTAYTAPSDLYNANTRGTLLETVKKPNSITYKDKEYTSIFTVSGEYNYIGVKSTGGLIQIEPILFSWSDTTPSESDILATNNFISSCMHLEISPNDSGTGLCKSESWYSTAKEKFNKLSDRQRAIILTSPSDISIVSEYEFTYPLIKERLLSWARNNHEELSNNKLSRINYIAPIIIKVDHIVLISIFTSVLTILSFIGYMIYKYKREHK